MTNLKQSDSTSPAAAHRLSIDACCDNAARSLRFLTGMVEACSGRVLSRRVEPNGSGALELEFERGQCVQVYCLLVAMGLELDRGSHLRLTAFCQCTLERFNEAVGEKAIMIIHLSQPGDALSEPDLSLEWNPAYSKAPVLYEA
jgi:hypothetical protein